MTTSPLPPDPYAILNVPKDATLTTIRSAHRKLVLTCHPDKVYDESVKTQKAEQFHQVQQAYEILSDESRRSRYDDRVKLAELRAEMMAQGGGRTRATHDFFSPRTPVSPMFETRGNTIYEERAPRRSYEDDFVGQKYDDRRPASRKYDDRYEVQSPRRSSGRGLDEKRRAREYEEEEREKERQRRAARDSVKAAERSAYSDRRKSRDKGRRQDYDSKYRPVQVESGTESDSDSTERYTSIRREPEPVKKQDEFRRREHEGRPRRSYKQDDSDCSDEHETKTHYRVVSAADYIAKSSGIKGPADTSEKRRSSVARGPSKETRVPPPPAPPPTHPPPPVELPRRGSGRTRSSGKDRRTPEIVEPQYERESSSRRPALSSATSEPLNIRIPPPLRSAPPRSATMVDRSADTKQHSSLRRAQTTPLSSMVSGHRGDTTPSKPSKLKNVDIHDSGYSSPGTPEMRAGYSPIFPPTSSTKYAIVEDEEEDEGVSGHRVVNIDPGHGRREREASPRTPYRAERPSQPTRVSSSVRPPPPRSATYGPEPLTPRPSSSRTPSARQAVPPPPVDGRLYGEVQSPQYKVQNYSKQYEPSDVQYARRASADSPQDHRDAYLHSETRSSRGSHPGIGMRGGSYVPESVH
ncbi:hypothetical protein MMC19_006524 [Ptychographa xylographoides]|nr:hypothetical protein [Ptychographa xylographoides]